MNGRTNPSVSQVPGKYLYLLVTRVNERNMIDREHVILALTRLRDFLVKRGIREVSMPVYDPNRRRLNPKGTIRYPRRGLCRNRNKGTSTQEVLLEYRLSFGWT